VKQTKTKTMETLSEAVSRLDDEGFDRAFRANREGLLEAEGAPPQRPEAMIVEEMVRFEGQSNPDDEAVLFALSSPDGDLKGTFVSSFGPDIGPATAAVIQRLRLPAARDR
jgi:hypothetical protein